MRQKPLFDNTPPELLARRQGEEVPLFVACGLGVNSAAAMILMHELGDRPDAVLFADTGGEKPETYAFLEFLDTWLLGVGFPAVTVVRRSVKPELQVHDAKYSTLEEECKVKQCLPSIAYYGRSYSEKWKQQPQEKWANRYPPARRRWKAGGRCLKMIGFDADERYRAKIQQNKKWSFWYPLLDYDWGRQECLEAIQKVGLPVPPKSSCFFCAEMTPPEILELGREHPDLLERALAMEANAHKINPEHKGLGKHEYSWRDLVDGKIPLPQVKEARMPCMCYDG